ncbi:hypothetical protein MLPM_2416A [Mycobacterium lepromatosis]|uniref:Uncharacterized protein n=1 Tax=Mycobacterium lepromatosis TaxID=480418 RepID=A0A0F4ENP9_9MYCO|nr:hypothetical protein MLPM_2416A [Mycobacterium lepromatosis]
MKFSSDNKTSVTAFNAKGVTATFKAVSNPPAASPTVRRNALQRATLARSWAAPARLLERSRSTLDLTTCPTTSRFSTTLSTTNLHHLPPSATGKIGFTDKATHQIQPIGFLGPHLRGQSASDEHSETATLPRRARRLLRSARRTTVPRWYGQLSTEVPGIVGYGYSHRL